MVIRVGDGYSLSADGAKFLFGDGAKPVKLTVLKALSNGLFLVGDSPHSYEGICRGVATLEFLNDRAYCTPISEAG